VAARRGSEVFASIYVPNGGKDFEAKMRFLEALLDWVGELHAAGDRVVLCGDMNVAHRDIDVHPKERKPVIGQRPDERALFDRLHARGLVDTARTLDPTNPEMFTWWAPWRNMRQRNIGWRLVYVLTGRALAGRATACPVQAAVGTSDHAPVMATFE
jgi:exodeoxyribonuclease-3